MVKEGREFQMGEGSSKNKIMSDNVTVRAKGEVLATSDKYTYFWGGVFSQWHPSKFKARVVAPALSSKNQNGEGPISYEWKSKEVAFNCTEQYMMYWKAYTFDDIDSCRQILNSPDPREQKALGRRVKNFDPEKWNAIAREKVYLGNYYKFTQDDFLNSELMYTEGTILVEASPFDKIWGIGLAQDNPKVLDPKQWEGSNWLGEVLTVLRDNLIIELETQNPAWLGFTPNAEYRGE